MHLVTTHLHGIIDSQVSPLWAPSERLSFDFLTATPPAAALPLANSASPANRIPTELIQIILQSLPQGELYRICTLCRAFLKEITYALFRHVDLTNSTIGQLTSLTSKVASRPDLAQLIYALSLPSLLSHNTPDEAIPERVNLFTEHLQRALKSTSNLTAIFILPPRDRGRSTRYLRVDHFIGCTFRLKVFRNDWSSWWLGKRTLLLFLSEQEDIQELETGNQYNPAPEPDSPTPNLLPNLSAVSTFYETADSPFLFSIIAQRNLTRLKLEMSNNCSPSDFANALRTLKSAGNTLTHFYFRFSHPRGMKEAGHVDILKCIATSFPNLKFLRYSDAQLVLNVSSFFFVTF
ncbi:hypothetical protein HWV62_32099 [Athelia sp. TMB]|nr:hypothetical protein HWV62_32099 [Athelia sp. TMB]